MFFISAGMKTLIATLALLAAAPAAAQAAPADPHAAHRQQSGQQHEHGKTEGEHAAHKDCCKDGKMECCAKMKQKDAADCCKDQQTKAGEQQDAHAGHDH